MGLLPDKKPDLKLVVAAVVCALVWAGLSWWAKTSTYRDFDLSLTAILTYNDAINMGRNASALVSRSAIDEKETASSLAAASYFEGARGFAHRTWFAHPDSQRIDTPLSASSSTDKEIFDTLTRLRGALLSNNPAIEIKLEDKQNEVVASVPVVTEGQAVGVITLARTVTPVLAVRSPWLEVLLVVAGVFYLSVLGSRWWIAILLSATGCLGFFSLVPALLLALREPLEMLNRAGGGSGIGNAQAVAALTSLPLPVSYRFLIELLVPLLLYLFSTSPPGRRLLGALWTHRHAYAYIAPAMGGMLLLVLFPFVYGLSLGFFEVNRAEWKFIWFRNFIEILSDFRVTLPENFYYTFGVTILWTVLNVALHVSLGLGLALLLMRPFLRLKGIWRALLILPWAIPNYITALIWKGLFHAQFGAVNAFLGLFGIPPVSWFNSFGTAFSANLATNVWLGFPFMMVVSLGALQSIPEDLYEAARVDGATAWQRFRHITLPLLKPALFPAVILGTIWTFNMFNIIYLVSGGAPAGATDILIVQAYRHAFEKYRYGYAAAYSTLIFIILFTYTALTSRTAKAVEE